MVPPCRSRRGVRCRGTLRVAVGCGRSSRRTVVPCPLFPPRRICLPSARVSVVGFFLRHSCLSLLMRAASLRGAFLFRIADLHSPCSSSARFAPLRGDVAIVCPQLLLSPPAPCPVFLPRGVVMLPSSLKAAGSSRFPFALPCCLERWHCRMLPLPHMLFQPDARLPPASSRFGLPPVTLTILRKKQ